MAQCVRWYLIIINSGRTKKPENCLNIKGMLGLAKEWAEQPHTNRGCFEVSGLWSLKLRLLQPEGTATVFSPSIPARASHLLFYVIHCLLSLLIQLKSEQVWKSLAVESKPMELHLGPPQGSEMPEKYPDDLPEPCCLVPQAGQDVRPWRTDSSMPQHTYPGLLSSAGRLWAFSIQLPVGFTHQ